MCSVYGVLSDRSHVSLTTDYEADRNILPEQQETEATRGLTS